jgi:hypothetical protein
LILSRSRDQLELMKHLYLSVVGKGIKGTQSMSAGEESTDFVSLPDSSFFLQRST